MRGALVGLVMVAGCATAQPLPPPRLVSSTGGVEVFVESYRPQYKCGRRSKRLERKAGLHYRLVVREVETGETETINLGPGDRELSVHGDVVVATLASDGPVTTACGDEASVPETLRLQLDP